MTAATRRSPELLAAMAGAGAMIAFQVAGRATRDALFLASHPVTQLPAMLVATAVLAAPLIIVVGAIMRRTGPARVIPSAYAVSAAMVFAIWAASFRFEGIAAIALFLHVGAAGPVLISGFWSIVNERFDPRTAKRHVGRIGALGTFGGLVGGFIANRLAVAGASGFMLPLLGVLHVACAIIMARIGAAPRVAVAPPPATTDDAAAAADGEQEIAGVTEFHTGVAILKRVSYLRSLAALVLILTAGEALLDYVFKAQATARFHSQDELMGLFSAFHTGVALVAFLLQTWLSRPALQGMGIARTVALLPVAMAAGGVAVMAIPGLVSATAARAADAVLRNSLFRSGYELLFNPVSPDEKRGTKALVDVGFARLGDAVGGLLAAALIGLGPASQMALPAAATLVALAGVAVVYTLHRGYVRVLETRLVRDADHFGGGAAAAAGPPSLDQTHTIDLATLRAHMAAVEATMAAEGKAGTTDSGTDPLPLPLEGVPPAMEPFVTRVLLLHSDDPARIRQGLHGELVGPDILPHVVPLLARDELSAEVAAVLQAALPDAMGQLADAMLDPTQPQAVRRRIPRILSAVPSARAVQGLLDGIEDRRFEVRVQCGRALARLHDRAPDLGIPADRVYAAVRREVKVERRIWEGQREIGRIEDSDESPFVDAYLRKRANTSLEHVFTLLSLILPAQPLRIAYRGLHTDDPMLRGTALEYLESVLPDEIRERLWPFLEEPEREEHPAREREQILTDLLRSNESIRINLDELRRLDEQSRGGPGEA